MRHVLAAALLLSAAFIDGAGAAEPIVGRWRLSNGETTRAVPCGRSYCITVETGKYKGKRIVQLARSGATYTGTVVDPTTDKTYDATVTVTGARLELKGCAFTVFCRSQTWTRHP